MKSLAWPVSRPGAWKPRFLTSSRPGVPIGWTVSDAPSATTSPCSSPSRAVVAAAIRKTISPAWVNRVAILVYWWRSPYRKRVPSSAAASRTRKPFRRSTRRMPSAGTASIAARSGRIGSKNGSGWSTRMSLTPRHSRGVRSSVQTTIDRIRTTSAALNHGERKIVNTDNRSSASTTPAPNSGSYRACMSVQRRGVVGRRPGRERRHLADRHADDREERQEDDLEDGEVDRREEVPQPVPEAGGDVPAGRSGRGRPRDLAARDGRAP